MSIIQNWHKDGTISRRIINLVKREFAAELFNTKFKRAHGIRYALARNTHFEVRRGRAIIRSLRHNIRTIK